MVVDPQRYDDNLFNILSIALIQPKPPLDTYEETLKQDESYVALNIIYFS